MVGLLQQAGVVPYDERRPHGGRRQRHHPHNRPRMKYEPYTRVALAADLPALRLRRGDVAGSYFQPAQPGNLFLQVSVACIKARR